MKLVRYRHRQHGATGFGAIVGEALIDFAAACAPAPVPAWASSMDAYLAALPGSAHEAAELLARMHGQPAAGTIPLDAVGLLAPLHRPALLADFAVAPRHLQNSARTLMRYEMPRWLAPLSTRIAAARYRRTPSASELKFYVGTGQPFIGPDATTGWPDYSRYVDVEAELAVITGAVAAGSSAQEAARSIAGYTIFNDVSARDVQFPEMKTGTLGFMRTKHFDRANGLGPWLVTPDELGDPRALDVTVDVGGRLQWQGRTAEYAFDVPTVIATLASVCSLPAGTVIGLGTVPGCCGLDTDQWPRPGERVTMRFTGLGCLQQRLGTPVAASSRWPMRSDWPSA